jgi:hypothetical protein
VIDPDGVLRTIVGEILSPEPFYLVLRMVGRAKAVLTKANASLGVRVTFVFLFPVRRWFSDSLLSASGEAGFGSAA